MFKNYVYNNFDISYGGESLALIVGGICGGLLIGVLISLISRVNSYRIIAALKSGGAVDEGSAKTLAELGLSRKRILKRMLTGGSPVKKLIGVTGDGAYAAKRGKIASFWYGKFLKMDMPTKISFERAKFYLTEENRISAELRFKRERHPVMSFIFAFIVLAGAAGFAVYVIPELLQMLDNFITSVKQ